MSGLHYDLKISQRIKIKTHGLQMASRVLGVIAVIAAVAIGLGIAYNLQADTIQDVPEEEETWNTEGAFGINKYEYKLVRGCIFCRQAGARPAGACQGRKPRGQDNN